MAVTKYKRQAESIIDFMECNKEILASSQEELRVQLRKPNITHYNLLTVFFDKRDKVMFARYGAGENCYFTNDRKVNAICGYFYDDEHHGCSADAIIYDIMNNWQTIKSEILGIISRSKAVESFTA